MVLRTSSTLFYSPVHTTLENLKTSFHSEKHQMFSVHPKPENFSKRKSPVTLDFFWKTNSRARKSRNVIFSKKIVFKTFPVYNKEKAPFC